MKGFINSYFFSTSSDEWELSSFIETYNEHKPIFSKQNCFYHYKESLQNICNTPKFNSNDKDMARSLLKSFNEDKDKYVELIKNQQNSIKLNIQDSVSILHYSNKLSSIYVTYKYFKLCITIESDDESCYEESNTIFGDKTVSWIVNSIDIYYQLIKYKAAGVTRTRPEYYNIIFFSNKNEGFLGTLDNNIIVQMCKDIEYGVIKESFENEIESFINNIVNQDIKKK
ncbi:456_t:CDS:1 [Dentiscutata erythropus]|uniref:456_t:CDS:1 n=1 Tax=Dentiscutata erythropus TaxID=1348616 RepID=A0A9N8YYG5_9GLOM|nr:456_t:CDS:1 [Dentiscutata erythropus]